MLQGGGVGKREKLFLFIGETVLEAGTWIWPCCSAYQRCACEASLADGSL